ncbi:MAG: hypothetical protein EON89_09635 [Brevundimonas sp.]|nr:MAG: hypothetical protein EON89_09635 [Brevundimonas sp.]
MKTLVLTLVLLAVPAAANAQARSALPGIDAMTRHEVMNQGLRRQAMEQNQDQYRDTINPRRVQRAEQAARLINEGNCPAAHELAVRANDRQLAMRIEQACGHVGNSMVASQPAASQPASAAN